MRLAKDEAQGVRLAVTQRTGVSAEVLALPAQDADEAVRTAVANNPGTLIEDLRILVAH
jgi:hypothetical protein